MPGTIELAGSQPRSGGPSVRLRRARIVLAASAVVFLGFVALGYLSILQAVIGFALVAAASLVGRLPNPIARPAIVVAERDPPDRSDPRLEAILGALPDPVIALARDERVVAFNRQAGDIVKRQAGDTARGLQRGAPAASLGLRMPDVLEALRRAVKTGREQQAEFVQRGSNDRWFEVVVAPLKYQPDARRNDLILMTFHDRTALRRVEEMRVSFVANASHELRTPLAALSGFIETLQGPARDDAAARERFLRIMHEQATRMARLVNDLLLLSRIELNAHLRPQTPVDLVSIVRQVKDSLETLARDSGVKIQIQVPDQPFIVLGDRDELTSVFENLIENALKYGAAGKRVEISFAEIEGSEGQREARVSVRDYGPGIAREHIPRLTERFYRVDVTESRAQGGTGLGLALVKHILNRHRGKLDIDSVLGSGATFTVRLPSAIKVGEPAVSSMNPAA
jgi:two-component system, OmpR family, phosphate regulon sensor histidine kinase PhoR